MKGDHMKQDPGESIFASFSKEHKIGADDIQQEVRSNDGRIVKSSHIITFHNGIFRTRNKKEIAWIKSRPDFLNGKIRLITPGEEATIIAGHAERLNLPADMVPTGGESDVGYDPEMKTDEHQPDNGPTAIIT